MVAKRNVWCESQRASVHRGRYRWPRPLFTMVQAAEETERQDLPQALVLLDEMNSNVRQVATLVDNMLTRVKSGEMTTDKGLSFLEMKYHMLLSYLINLTYIVLRKCSGEKIEADPAIDRLVEIRTVLEKIRPIDSKLKYQIDKLVKGAVTVAGSGNDPGLFRANPDNLVSKVDSEMESEASEEEKEVKDPTEVKTGLYVPPKFAAMHYDGDETKAEREKRQTERQRKRALNSSVIRELRDEYLDTPTEVTSGVRGQRATSKYQREKTEYEESYLTRLPVTKAEKHRQRKVTTVGNIADEITNFGDYSALDDDNPGNGGAKKKKKRKIVHKKGKMFKKIRFH